MLENHVLAQFENICRFKLGFTNKFNDKEIVESLCNQNPTYFNIQEMFDRINSRNQSTIMDITMENENENSSFRFL